MLQNNNSTHVLRRQDATELTPEEKLSPQVIEELYDSIIEKAKRLLGNEFDR